MTPQRIFNKVAKHLLKQNAQSLYSDGGCAYHGSDGLRCAIGCFIPNSVSTKSIEGRGLQVIYDQLPILRRVFRAKASRNIGIELQSIHDTYFPANWKTMLRRLALEYNLNTTVLTKVSNAKSR